MIAQVLSNGTVVIVKDDLTTLIVQPDGREVPGAPRASQKAMADCLGYSNEASMVAHHDPLHALLCDWLGMPSSLALSGQKSAVAGAEEDAVLAVQRLMCLAGITRLPWMR